MSVVLKVGPEDPQGSHYLMFMPIILSISNTKTQKIFFEFYTVCNDTSQHKHSSQWVNIGEK